MQIQDHHHPLQPDHRCANLFMVPPHKEGIIADYGFSSNILAECLTEKGLSDFSGL